MEYVANIGLEIHAQLLTETKIFCSCPARFGNGPNENTCPVCLGLPGALPVLNEKAVELALKIALSLGCRINEESVFARKNYFYPDLPKGYQISMYERPLAEGGGLAIDTPGAESPTVGITRLHLEEDAGKSIHEGRPDSSRRTYLDFNRCGIPLVEIVTEPEIRSATGAVRFVESLRLLLLYLGACDGNMAEGSLRCDANVSLSRAGSGSLGVKREIKNLNSLKAIERGIAHELESQEEILSKGGEIVRGTLLWDEREEVTRLMRVKEESPDYRYFPEPDLLPLKVAPESLDEIRESIPELPRERRERFERDYGISANDAPILVSSPDLADYFEKTAAASGNPRGAGSWIVVEILKHLKERGEEIGRFPVPPESLGSLIKMVDGGVISKVKAKEILYILIEEGGDPVSIVEKEGLAQIRDDDTLIEMIEKVIEENRDVASRYRAGHEKALDFLVGQVMKRSNGKADPKRTRELIRGRTALKY